MRTTITLGGHDVPAFESRGTADGPRVAVLGGVHGCEYSSIAAVIRLMRGLGEHTGTVVGVPVVSMDSFTQRSPFVVPEDGQNLNRAFPGDPDGSYTDRLAHDIFTQLIEPADAVLDLHGGDLVEALEPFAIYNDARSRDLAAPADGFLLHLALRRPLAALPERVTDVRHRPLDFRLGVSLRLHAVGTIRSSSGSPTRSIR